MTRLASDAGRPEPRTREAAGRSNGADTRERIIQAATAEFKVVGYDGTTVSSIARASGVTTPALYWHFPSKEEICFACLERIYDEQYAVVCAANVGQDASERLGSVVDAWVRDVLSDRQLATGFNPNQLIRSLSDDHRKALRRKEVEFQQLMLGILSDGVTEGSFAVKDPIVTANLIMTACDYVFVWLKPSPEHPVDDIAARYAELMVAMASGGAR
jgi:AcrR family transcriptional regulator